MLRLKLFGWLLSQKLANQLSIVFWSCFSKVANEETLPIYVSQSWANQKRCLRKQCFQAIFPKGAWVVSYALLAKVSKLFSSHVSQRWANQKHCCENIVSKPCSPKGGLFFTYVLQKLTNHFRAMFPKAGQTTKRCFSVTLSKDGQTNYTN